MSNKASPAIFLYAYLPKLGLYPMSASFLFFTIYFFYLIGKEVKWWFHVDGQIQHVVYQLLIPYGSSSKNYFDHSLFVITLFDSALLQHGRRASHQDFPETLWEQSDISWPRQCLFWELEWRGCQECTMPQRVHCSAQRHIGAQFENHCPREITTNKTVS